MNFRSKVITIILHLSFLFFYSQEIPPIENYMPANYRAGNQNWMISQGQDNYIYAANNEGLLEFNGTEWRLYPSPNESIIRSVKVVGDKIYTGCYMQFGYWEQNDNKELQYTSLSDRIKDKLVEDEHFWRIVPYSKWIIFQSLNQIFIYDLDSETFKIISDPNGIVFVYKVNDAILFQVPGNGIYEIENGEKQLICNDRQIINTRIINIFPNEDDLLLVTEANGLFKLKNGKVEKISSPLGELLGTTNIYSALQRANGDLVLGTISRGVIISTSRGIIKYHLSHTDGIGNNTVLSVFEDMDHNIWLGLDNGISCINIQSPIRTYYDHEGILGTVYTAISYNERLYVGTNQGLFSRKLNSEGTFRFVEGTNGQAWSLFKREGQLFCGHNRGTFLVHGIEARLISNIEGVWKFLEVPGHPDWLLQGSYGGLSILERSGNDNWKLRNRIDGFDYSSMNFEFFNDTTLYVSHEHKGVFKILLNPEYTRAINTEKLQELEKGKSASLVKFNNSLLYANRKGVFRLFPGEREFIKDSLLTHIIEGNEFFTGKMVVDDVGKLWFFTKDGIHYLTQEKLSGAPVVKDISIPLSLRKTVGGFENIAHIANNTYLTGSKSGFFTIDLNQVEESDYELILNRILISDLKKNTSFYAPLSENGNFKNSDNNIIFSFSIPEYEKYVLTKYQYKLEGLYDYWSDWSADASARFENLPHGNYRFYVRGKVGNNITSNIGIYEFTIQRPWYLSSGMLTIYGLCIVLGAILVHTFYKRYYRDQEQKLIEKNKRELELTRTQNEKELIRLKNEKLRQDIKSKSKELAASTMNVVRKNELLTDIKEHLLSVEDKEAIAPVLKIINKNLEKNDNWELFKEAFTNVDREFLNKLTSLHPNLSPNDIRLCTYLRLNLSSKEIAPLFNISSRSVEIKRYRLRKKMNLPHEENLVSYIIDL